MFEIIRYNDKKPKEVTHNRVAFFFYFYSEDKEV